MDGSWFNAMGEWIGAAPVAAVFAFVACVAILYTFLALVSLKRFAPPAAAPAHPSGVTVLKPLYGAETGLYDHLLSFCRQNYAGPAQIIFGVNRDDDPAAAAARRIVALARAGKIDGAPAGLSVELMVDATAHGSNGKVSNLINLSRRIEHPLVVLADSDISVEPDYLDRLAAAIERPGVGLVTCLYRGRPLAGFWSRLGAMGVDYGFLPNVLTGMALNMAEPCVGATIALRRSTLDAIGGFARVKDQLADDYMIGEAVRETGQKIAVADFVVGHAHAERSFGEVWRRDLRWARTIHSLDPLGHIGSAVTFPVAWALLALLASGFAPAMAALAGAAVLARMVLQFEIDARFPGHDHALWLGPVRDLFSFAVFVASFLPGQIHWRGHDYALSG
ncbi:bacteriohopanetetrol glucosamine biosynthesis glycosyltransferase HpnI, partial [Rhodoblastus sp.]